MHCYTSIFIYVQTEIAQWLQPTRVTRRYRHIPGWCHLTWLWTNAGQHILAVHLTQIPGEWDWGLYHHGHNLQPRWQRGSHFTTKSGGATFHKSGCLIKFSVSIWPKNFSFVLCWLGLCTVINGFRPDYFSKNKSSDNQNITIIY